MTSTSAAASTTAAASGVSASSTSSLDDELLQMLSSGDHDFSVANYLNLALRDVSNPTLSDPNNNNNNPNDHSVISSRLAELALQLQFQTANCHEEIGKLGAELRAIVPRCAADVGRISVGLGGLQQDAVALQTAADAALQQQHQGSGDASTSLETLSTLHALEANLSRTREILTAAATWDETLAAMPALLAASNLPAAVGKLATLEKGEAALRGMPDPQSRQAALQKVRTQVSTLLQPQLAHALQTMQSRLGPLQQCVTLYAQLNMLEQLQHEYVKHRPASLHKLWFDYQQPLPNYSNSNDQDGSGGGGGGENESAVTTTSSSLSSRQAFADWLPTWFEAVLQVLQEERRQAATVFGPAAVPTLMVAILREAIRPVLPSFGNRLASLSLNQVTQVYNAALQCLSLAYDLIATVHLDYMESRATTTTTTGTADNNITTAAAATSDKASSSSLPVSSSSSSSLQLWRDFESVVVDVLGQPFRSTQTRWTNLEKEVGQAQINQARTSLQRLLLNNRQGGLEQAAVEEMWQWLTTAPAAAGTGATRDSSATTPTNQQQPAMIALVQQGLGRFRLLRGGYGADQAVTLLDNLLSQYIQQVTQAVQQWSERTDGQQQDAYEDSHVMAALSMLRIAGWIYKECQNLQEGTRQELTVLTGRIETHLRFLEGLPTTKKKSGAAPTPRSHKFVLPDSLSTVEINGLLTLAAESAGEADQQEPVDTAQTTLATLERLRDEKVLFAKSQQAITFLSQSCHVFCFNVCFSVPRLHLAELSSLEAWRKAASSEDALSSYGTLPQSYITQVGEHMLSLVQALEPFAADSATLTLVKPVMQNLRHAAAQPWKELLQASSRVEGLADDRKVLERLMDGKELLDLVLGAPLDEEPDEEEEEADGEDEQAKAVTQFCNAWLDVVGLAVTGRLLERILRIPTLTSKGCEHLQADLNYLVNVLNALGVQGHPHPLLGHFAELAVLEVDTLRERIQAHDATREPVERCLMAMEERLVAMRQK